MSILKELIAQQTDIQSAIQLLVFDGELLDDHVQPVLPVSSYPEGITWKNPIFCYHKNGGDISEFPLIPMSMYPLLSFLL